MTTTVKHTPGPWRHEAAAHPGGHFVKAGNETLVEFGWLTRFTEAEANARLMAASPELLKELRSAAPLLLTLCTVALNPKIADYLPFGTVEQVKSWLRYNNAEAVIAEATGQDVTP